LEVAQYDTWQERELRELQKVFYTNMLLCMVTSAEEVAANYANEVLDEVKIPSPEVNLTEPRRNIDKLITAQGIFCSEPTKIMIIFDADHTVPEADTSPLIWEIEDPVEGRKDPLRTI
jgi:translation initiation factor 2B subunit (eIF-2B alpha/beta/delta family)